MSGTSAHLIQITFIQHNTDTKQLPEIITADLDIKKQYMNLAFWIFSSRIFMMSTFLTLKLSDTFLFRNTV